MIEDKREIKKIKEGWDRREKEMKEKKRKMLGKERKKNGKIGGWDDKERRKE